MSRFSMLLAAAAATSAAAAARAGLQAHDYNDVYPVWPPVRWSDGLGDPIAVDSVSILRGMRAAREGLRPSAACISPRPSFLQVGVSWRAGGPGCTAALAAVTRRFVANAAAAVFAPPHSKAAAVAAAATGAAPVVVTLTVADDCAAAVPHPDTDYGYELAVAPPAAPTGSVTVAVKAATRFGAQYALESLSHLLRRVALPDGTARHLLRPIHIVDAPQYAWRGLMLDTGRRFFPVDNVKEVRERGGRSLRLGSLMRQ
jgi:hypothetical protein